MHTKLFELHGRIIAQQRSTSEGVSDRDTALHCCSVSLGSCPTASNSSIAMRAKSFLAILITGETVTSLLVQAIYQMLSLSGGANHLRWWRRQGVRSPQWGQAAFGAAPLPFQACPLLECWPGSLCGCEDLKPLLCPAPAPMHCG